MREDFLLNARDICAHPLAHFAQESVINFHARAFHIGDDGNEGHFHSREQLLDLEARQFRRKLLPEAIGEGGIGGRIGRGIGNGHLIHGFLRTAAAQQFFDIGHFNAPAGAGPALSDR